MSVAQRKTALVTGAGSGLGLCIADALERQGAFVIRWDYNIEPAHDVREPKGMFQGDLDILVNCAGVNQQSWLEDITKAHWDRVMETNAWGIANMTRYCVGALRHSRGTVVNIVSNAAHIPMRCSAAYNASKGAALILTKQMARELSPEVTVFSVSPNKLADTGMSRQIDAEVQRTRGWTAEEAHDYQLQSLLTGEETPPEVLAEFIAFLLSTKERHKYLTGCDIPYGA